MTKRSDNPRPLIHHLGPLACAATLFVLFPHISRGQSSTDPPPANPAPAVASPASATGASQKPASPVKPKHVITNEDLEPHSGNDAKDGSFIPGEGSLLTCDSSCEQTARNELGYDSDNEAEWRVQIVRARRDLLEDTAWRGLLSQSVQQTNHYCNFLLQQSQQTAPSGNDYNSRTQQARNANYFENMGRTLRQGLESLTNRMQEHIQEVRLLSPARAAMMNAQATRILVRTCELPGSR
ncbi:MAG TPA: hypothetical protein VK728_13690 [Candidatus Sulfotelmatobacter sp.]|jgi:hypothetical protein|nr:hypothetical protein [Candidatus Sulfotelmatobacter sp.]